MRHLSISTSTSSSTARDAKSYTISPSESLSPLRHLQFTVYKPAQPSLTLLLSFLTRRDIFSFFLPALLSSILSGGIAPFMTIAVGQAFDAFARYPLSNPTQQDNHRLLQSVGKSALELLILGIGALVLGSITSSLWISTGERNVRGLRRSLYQSITEKEMIWFDKKMISDESGQPQTEDDGTIGAGGMMAQFAKDTDDVRMASSLALGLTIQYLVTSVTALILGFIGSWSLTLVVLATFPILILLGGLAQGLSQPIIMAERSLTGVAATIVERAVAAIATVKAFNAVDYERDSLQKVLNNMKYVADRLTVLWGLNLGLTQFFMMAMFVQAFWYGSKLVRDGTNTPGEVMTVFWACLITTSNIHMASQHFVTLTKGKSAMASVVDLMNAPVELDDSPNGRSNYQVDLTRKVRKLKKITPKKCNGFLELVDITFAYPSRPTVQVLDSVSMFFSQGDMTFVVGGSGSGKSTVAQLLARMYTPQFGQIILDQQDIHVLDEEYVCQHVALVSQTSIMFDMSLHDNVAMGLAGSPSGRKPEDVTRAEVEKACRIALLHEFVRDLPQGYDTMLVNGGVNLSGGQKQRLAIARAYIRNPTVLILDESLSALDPTSRLLVFEAIKQWRKNKTTIVITHDLTQVSRDDFVFVMKDGCNVEAGYRVDLDEMDDGFFVHLARSQGAVPAPEYNLDQEFTQQERRVQALLDSKESSGEYIKLEPQRPIVMKGWMFDVVSDLTKTAGLQPQNASPVRASGPLVAEAFEPSPAHIRSSSVVDISRSPTTPTLDRRLSLLLAPTLTHPTNSHPPAHVVSPTFEMPDVAANGTYASRRRILGTRMRTRHDAMELKNIVVDRQKPTNFFVAGSTSDLSLWQLMREVYPTIPYKFYMIIGLMVATASGSITPIFSFVLSHLFVQISNGATNVSLINKYGGIVLALAAIDGILLGLKYFILEKVAMSWVTNIRNKCFRLVLLQDKKWFDKVDGENAPSKMVQILIKDGDDARSLIATVFPQILVVVAMFGTGMIWAVALGWQLTLVGLAIAPIFAVAMTVQAKLVSKCEARNKKAREEVAKKYYEAISNIRAIRAMSFNKFFEQSFENSVQSAYTTGVAGAFVEGCTLGVTSSLIYLSEAILFYVGAVFIIRGTYTYIQMVEILNLIVFTVSLGSQLMTFTERISKALQATKDFHRLLQLKTDGDESQGAACPSIEGTLTLEDVSFTYPARFGTEVLKNACVRISEGECVAVVGASGSGKSTIAALLLRLYQPTSGSLKIGPHDIADMNVSYLRNHIAIVSQNPNLFDATITENISYGTKNLSFEDVRQAAMRANVHDFIMSLPNGYDTMVGENAALISGGQAQRIQIARAVARPSKVLILDECTSAMDAHNQAAVLDMIREARIGRTTVMITHKLAAMKICDRILVLDGGRIVEDGTFDELLERNGVFTQLARGGEWIGQ